MFISLYKIRKGASYPQAIIMASFFMILIIYSVTLFDLYTLMPKYLTYGAQDTNVSQISKFSQHILVENPVFSSINFIMSLMFCTMSFIHLIRGIISGENSIKFDRSSEETELDEMWNKNKIEYEILFEQNAESLAI